jgi:alpha-L-fucosidase
MLGGEWQGKNYKGYAEHIQRQAKIPCTVYRRDVVGQFNPVNFDAEAWVRAIKAAGMRYLIITAKHHDGFAMFASAASDYNIVKATPFGRDPMKELKAACDRAGLKFGFYYSHAFDWGEPNAPGNDWDYENPGGDRGLFGGGDWWAQHPEIIPRMRPYIEDKAIPQLRELIKGYDPAIIWFDTAHKLPPSENLRILAAVRAANPGIVINSRGVSGYSGVPERRFGDYQSTGDRAVDFRPTEGDWETIPTCNESYGYHKQDHSHKKPGFLVQVMAKAAARGGNMLLNIGPRGDGMIDEPELAILAGMGKWMEVNEVSIRGTTRTTLPVQPWGESTRKGQTFYLHVFDWPTDGVLELGGFQGEIQKAWLLADPKRTELLHRRVDKNTVRLTVPKSAPDSADSVVVLDVSDIAKTSDRRLISDRQANLLRAFDAVPVGPGLTYGDGKADRNTASKWTSQEQALTWPAYLSTPATYEVAVEYISEGKIGTIRVSGGDVVLTAETDGDQKDFRERVVGRMKLPAGPVDLEIRPNQPPVGGLMRFRALHLRAVKE